MNDTIFLIIAPSGAGKTTITERLEALYGLKSTKFTVNNNDINTAVLEQLYTYDLCIIDPKGVDFFRTAYHGDKQVKTIYIKSEMAVRYERMKSRYENSGMTFSESTDETLTRIKNDNNEFREYELFNIADFTVNNEENDILDDVVDKVYNYIVRVRGE